MRVRGNDIDRFGERERKRARARERERENSATLQGYIRACNEPTRPRVCLSVQTCVRLRCHLSPSRPRLRPQTTTLLQFADGQRCKQWCTLSEAYAELKPREKQREDAADGAVVHLRSPTSMFSFPRIVLFSQRACKEGTPGRGRGEQEAEAANRGFHGRTQTRQMWAVLYRRAHTPCLQTLRQHKSTPTPNGCSSV